MAVAQIPERLKFNFYSVKDGLPHPIISSMSQDRQGFLWITTSDGICKFDGRSFKTYLNVDSAKTGLRYSSNHSAIDHLNRLWVIQMPNVAWFDHKNDRFRALTIPFPDRKTVHESILYFDETTHLLWVATGSGLFRLNTDTFRFEKMPIDHFIRVHDMLEDGYGNIVVVDSDGGVFVVNKVTGKFKTYPIYGVKAFRDYQKNIWIGQWRHESNLIKFNTQTGQYQTFINPYILPTRTLSTIPRLTGDTLLWVGLRENGMALFNIKTNKWVHHYSYESLKSVGFQGRRISRQYIDNKGVLWISSDLDLAVLNPDDQGFVTEKLVGISKHTEYDIWGILPVATNPGYWWLQMGYDGLIYYDRRKNKVLNHFFKASSDARSVVLNMTFDKQGRLWTGGDAGVVVYDQQPHIVKQIRLPPTKRIQFDAYGRTWIGTQGGLFCYEEKSETLRHFKSKENSNNGLISNDINNLLIDGDLLWVGTINGFNRFNLKTEKWERFYCPTSSPNASKARRLSFDGNQIIELVKDPNQNRLWIATYDGLIRFDVATRKFKSYRHQEGLRNLTVMTLIFDKNGFLWANTGSSLHRFDPKTEKFTRFDENDGLYSSNTLGGGLSSDHTGKMYLPFEDHYLTSFRPEHITTSRAAVKPVFTGFKLLEEPQPIALDSVHLKPLRIRDYQNVLTFEFSSVDFTQSEKITFDYRLDGFDKTWQSAGTNRSLTYTNLDDGKYTFQVRATNAVGQRSEPAVFRLEVWRPFWLKPWFGGIVAALLTGLGLWALFTYRYKQQLKLLHLRTNIARDLHDDMGSYLSSISIMSQNVEKMAERNPEKATESLKKIGETARKVMDTMSEIVWSVSPEYDSMEHIVGRMKDAASELFSSQETVVRFDISDEVLLFNLPLEKRRDFFLIYKEALTNAAKYAYAKQVTISLKIDKGNLLLTINDNGKGFDIHRLPASNGKGNGLKNMHARAKQINGLVKIKTNIGMGCTVSLKLTI